MQTLVVSQVTPSLSFTNFPANTVYRYSILVTANLISINNQLSARLFINNVNAGSFANQLTVSVINPGNYLFVANTLGNNNYTAVSISNTLQVSGQVILKAPTLNIPVNVITYGTPEAITAIANPSTDGIEILVNGAVQASKVSGLLTYSFPVSASGSYSVNAFDTTNKTSMRAGCEQGTSCTVIT